MEEKGGNPFVYADGELVSLGGFAWFEGEKYRVVALSHKGKVALRKDGERGVVWKNALKVCGKTPQKSKKPLVKVTVECGDYAEVFEGNCAVVSVNSDSQVDCLVKLSGADILDLRETFLAVKENMEAIMHDIKEVDE